jgi:hypothetical protein
MDEVEEFMDAVPKGERGLHDATKHLLEFSSAGPREAVLSRCA